MNPLFAFLGLGPMEISIVAVLGILLFGRKLPEVGRSLGKGIVEFKKGLRGMEDEVEGGVVRTEPALEQPRPPQRVATTAPKFEDTAGVVTPMPPKA